MSRYTHDNDAVAVVLSASRELDEQLISCAEKLLVHHSSVVIVAPGARAERRLFGERMWLHTVALSPLMLRDVEPSTSPNAMKRVVFNRLVWRLCRTADRYHAWDVRLRRLKYPELVRAACEESAAIVCADGREMLESAVVAATTLGCPAALSGRSLRSDPRRGMECLSLGQRMTLGIRAWRYRGVPAVEDTIGFPIDATTPTAR